MSDHFSSTQRHAKVTWGPGQGMKAIALDSGMNPVKRLVQHYVCTTIICIVISLNPPTPPLNSQNTTRKM